MLSIRRRFGWSQYYATDPPKRCCLSQSTQGKVARSPRFWAEASTSVAAPRIGLTGVIDKSPTTAMGKKPAVQQ